MFPRLDRNGSLECTLEDTEAAEVILGNASGVFKVRTVKRRAPSQRWNESNVMKMVNTPGQPHGDGVASTACVTPQDLGVKGRVKPAPGLERVDYSSYTAMRCNIICDIKI